MNTKLTILLLSLSLLPACYGGRHQKHTQACQLVFISPGGRLYWFMRANREVFAMNFDNPPALPIGTSFKDVTYFDDSADQVHFVKAQIAEPTPPPKKR